MWRITTIARERWERKSCTFVPCLFMSPQQSMLSQRNVKSGPFFDDKGMCCTRNRLKSPLLTSCVMFSPLLTNYTSYKLLTSFLSWKPIVWLFQRADSMWGAGNVSILWHHTQILSEVFGYLQSWNMSFLDSVGWLCKPSTASALPSGKQQRNLDWHMGVTPFLNFRHW